MQQPPHRQHTHTTIIMPRKRPTLKETQANQKIQWADVPPNIQQAIMYLETRRLRHDA